MIFVRSLFLLCTSFVYANNSYSLASSKSASLSDGVFTAFEFFHGALQGLCIIAAMFLLVNAIYQYSQHRVDPVRIPFSKPLVLFVCALCLFAFAIVPLQSW